MELKKCPKCKKELPIEARFCPYCMTKLIHENGKVSIEKNHSKKKLYTTIVILLVIVCTELIGILFIAEVNNKKSNKAYNQQSVDSNTNKISKSGKNTSNDVSSNTAENYSNYLGTWYANDVKDIKKEGGEKIEICKVTGDTIIFCVDKVTADYTKIATIEYVRATLINGRAGFSYTDDGYGNDGYGTITLKNNKIHVQVDVNNADNVTGWDLIMDSDFYQKKKIDIKKQVDINGLTGQYLEDVKGMFGRRTKVTQDGQYAEYEYENGIYLRTVPDPNNQAPVVINIKIFYDWINDSAIRINYRGISEKTQKSDLKNILSDFDIVYKSKYRRTYQNNKTLDTVDIYFDNDGIINQISYS